MIIPALQGCLNQPDFFIYVAADSQYFDRFGKALINSVIRNTAYGIHVHIYDPTDKQLRFCEKNQVSVSWEVLSASQFDKAEEFWSQPNLPEPYASRRNKMLGLKQFSDNENLKLWLKKTYYACMRFVRLAELLDKPQRLLEIDIDGIVRKSFPIKLEDRECDIYLYEKSKIDKTTNQPMFTGHLAGSILFTENQDSLRFIHELADNIRLEIEADNVYWFLDQNCLDDVVPKYRKGILPSSYIDWRMLPDSCIWTAKGKRKDLAVFKNELAKYL